MIPEIELHRNEIIALCEEYGLVRLELFGSAATGDFDPAGSASTAQSTAISTASADATSKANAAQAAAIADRLGTLQEGSQERDEVVQACREELLLIRTFLMQLAGREP